MKEKKIAIVTTSFYPNTGAGNRRVTNLAKNLAENGFKVSIITLGNKESTGFETDREEVKKLTEFHSVEIVRFPYPKMNKYITFILKAARKYMMWDPYLDWVIINKLKIERFIMNEGIENLFITSPSYAVQLIGLDLKMRHKNVSWIADFRDPWTGNSYHNHNRLKSVFINYYELRFLQRSDKVTVISDGMKEFYKSMTLENKIVVIYNGFDGEEKLDCKKQKTDNSKNIVYTGITYKDRERALASFVKVLCENLECKIGDNDLVFKIAGMVSKDIERLLREKMPRNHQYSGFVSLKESLCMQKNADLLILPIGSKLEITSKIYEYLATENPILCIMKEKNEELERILIKTRAGKAVMFDDTDAIIQAVSMLLGGEMKRNMEEVEKFNYKNITQKLITLLRR